MDALRLGCVDDVLSEPKGGSQTDPAEAMGMLDTKLRWHLAELQAMPEAERLEKRYQKFRTMAQFYTVD
jgi:acetyl-CoA carboxylase carboxyl transferase subunit alpha